MVRDKGSAIFIQQFITGHSRNDISIVNGPKLVDFITYGSYIYFSISTKVIIQCNLRKCCNLKQYLKVSKLTTLVLNVTLFHKSLILRETNIKILRSYAIKGTLMCRNLTIYCSLVTVNAIILTYYCKTDIYLYIYKLQVCICLLYVQLLIYYITASTHASRLQIDPYIYK